MLDDQIIKQAPEEALSELQPSAQRFEVEPLRGAANRRDRGHEAALLIVGDTMYVVTPYPNILYALDLKNAGAQSFYGDSGHARGRAFYASDFRAVAADARRRSVRQITD